jgi:L-malate glycosyltransferase
MRMKVLIVGHTYMLRMNRRKFVEMALQNPDIEITFLCPKIYSNFMFQINAEPLTKEEAGFTLLLSPLTKGRRGSAYFYPPLILSKALAAAPDVIQVDDGPHSLAYFESLMMSRFLTPRAKTFFFTWANTHYRLDPIRKVFEFYNFRRTDGAIAGNADAAAILRARGFSKPIHVTPQLGVDPNEYRPIDMSALKAQFGLEDSFVIGFMGRVVREKGIHILLRSLPYLHGANWRLVIVGDGDYKEELISQAANLGLTDRVLFLDPVPHHESPNMINLMDVLVLPSVSVPEWREQFGHVLIEAMACGVTVVGSTCGEIPNVIGDAGLVFSEGNAQELGEKLSMLSDDRELRIRLAKKGQERVAREYTHSVLGKKLFQIYQDTVSNRAN